MNNELQYLFNMLRKHIVLCGDRVSASVREYTEEIIEKCTSDVNSKSICEQQLGSLAESAGVLGTIYLYSAAYALNSNPHWYELMLNKAILCKNVIGVDGILYLCRQCESINFLFPKTNNLSLFKKQMELYNWASDKYAQNLKEYLKPIPKEERNEDLVFVITDQFLDISHGPTKSACDRCKILIERMNKRVILINTAEMLSQVGFIDFYLPSVGNYNETLCDCNLFSWKNCKIPFFQCDNYMPNLETIQMLINLLYEQKPAFIVGIGSSGMVTSLMSKIVPSLNVGMCPSVIEPTGAQYMTYSGKMDSESKEYLKAMRKNENSVILSTFGSSIVEQKKVYTRESLGIKNNDFVIALVGGRLNDELDSSFWEMAYTLIKDHINLKFIIIGNFSREQDLNEELRSVIINIGFTDDVLAYLDICDLYMNPIRRGGGTSCVEAMSKGKPVITTQYGDVAVNAGEDFCVKSYQEFLPQVDRYINDRDFYNDMRKKALERSGVLLNAEDEFVRIIGEFLDRISSDNNCIM